MVKVPCAREFPTIKGIKGSKKRAKAKIFSFFLFNLKRRIGKNRKKVGREITARANRGKEKMCQEGR